MALEFFSFVFLFFMIFSLVIYWLLNGKTKLQNVFLMILSYIFYCLISIWLGVIILISTIFNFATGYKIGTTKKTEFKKYLLYSAIVCNIAYLFVFRYFNFFSTEMFNLLNSFGLTISPYLLYLIIPIGISYYTLSALSYNLDIYWNNIKPTKNFISFSLFMVYFPKIIAGPIERPSTLIPQLSIKKHLTEKDISGAIQLILIGLFKKIVIADFLQGFTHGLYDNPSRFSSTEALIIVWLFVIQLYADFSGYTSIVRGISRFFGINLRINFKQPLLSTNISDLWRRWHMSLTSWMRDYLYIPLGGNKKGFSRSSLNLIIVFLIAGLWHGPLITMAIWGLISGVYIIFHRIYSMLIQKWSFFNKLKSMNLKNSPLKYILLRYFYLFMAWFITFQIFAISVTFFATEDLRHALKITRLILSFQFNFSYDDYLYKLINLLIFSSILTLLFDIPEYKLKTDEIFTKLHWILRGLCFLFMVIMIILFRFAPTEGAFLYEGY